MRIRVAASLAVVFLVVALAAQSVRPGAIAGTVLDASGNGLAGARVLLSGPERRTLTTDKNGRYEFRNLPSGQYQLIFELQGYSSVARMIDVTSRAEQLNITLSAAQHVESLAREAGAAASAKVVEVAPQTLMEAASAMRQEFDIGGGVYLPGRYTGPMNTEAYDSLDENPFRRVTVDPLSTFSIDVDTASYANVRRFLNDGRMPPPGAVRIEELINYFRYDYPQPKNGEPFSITTELAACPWNPKHRLALIGLQGQELAAKDPAPRNLVFLVDVSGSMSTPDKLPLVRNAMRMLTDVLTSRDRVAIVVYAGASGLVLPSTAASEKGRIHRALAELEAGGSTNGGAGIKLAYRVAQDNFIKGGVNRVILATDGDFNVGVTSQDELVRLIEQQRAGGVFLSVLGVGTGNLKDSTMEKLADKGNGNYAYLDSLHEARKVLVREAGSTLITVAKDVKIQVEFNQAAVAAYRLIGYENRMLRNEDFNDDTKDAGEIGAGHSVTALYEIVPAGVRVDTPSVDPLRYQQNPEPTRFARSDELVSVKLRYKAPDGDVSKLISTTLRNRTGAMSANLGFASAVAEFGMLLGNSTHAAGSTYDAAARRAGQFRGVDADGYRGEFVRLVELASSLNKLTSVR